MNIAQLLAASAALGLERLDSQLLLLHALGRAGTERAWLVSHDRDKLSAADQQRYLGLAARRASGEPLAYIVGQKEFFGLALLVNPSVLIPRPDTETLVEWALELVTGACTVLDLGTGSGAIALAIKQARPQARVVAVDTSGAALEVARANAQRLGLAVDFQQASWWRGATGRCDLAVSNPPYVAAADPHLAALAHEPLEALTGGADGLDHIRAIAAGAPAYLVPGGWLLLEHGWNQAREVRGLLAQAGLTEVSSRRDLAGIERCSGGRLPEQR